MTGLKMVGRLPGGMWVMISLFATSSSSIGNRLPSIQQFYTKLKISFS